MYTVINYTLPIYKVVRYKPVFILTQHKAYRTKKMHR